MGLTGTLPSQAAGVVQRLLGGALCPHLLCVEGGRCGPEAPAQTQSPALPHPLPATLPVSEAVGPTLTQKRKVLCQHADTAPHSTGLGFWLQRPLPDAGRLQPVPQIKICSQGAPRCSQLMAQPRSPALSQVPTRSPAASRRPLHKLPRQETLERNREVASHVQPTVLIALGPIPPLL